MPKTLIKFVIDWFAEWDISSLGTSDLLYNTLKDIVSTEVSPELLPRGNDGGIVQRTEDILGAYELHDFFLFHFVRNGFSPAKISYLASQARFEGKYSCETVHKALRLFVDRFFSQQFKRSCVPDGPKVGSVSLSPRGDWRMPSDADRALWQEELYKW